MDREWRASKLLRTFHERAVTIAYIDEHPEEMSSFTDYHAVAQKKLFYSLQEVFGKEHMPRGSEEKMLADFNEVKERFMVTLCEKCGMRRLNHTWSKLDFVSMAKSTGALGQIFAEIELLQREQNWNRMASDMVTAAYQLQSGGADCIVLCPNTMHEAANAIQSAVSIPLIHIADATALAVKDMGIAAPGLLGTHFTMEDGSYLKLYDK